MAEESREALLLKLSLRLTSKRRREGTLPVSVGTTVIVVSPKFVDMVTGIGTCEFMAAVVVGRITDTTGMGELTDESVASELTVMIRDNDGLLVIIPGFCSALASWMVPGLLACRVLFSEPVSNSLIGDKRNVTGTSETPGLFAGYIDGVLAN